MLNLKTAIQEDSKIIVTFDGPVSIERVKAKDPEKGLSGYGCTIAGMGFSEYVGIELEVPAGGYQGARCLGRVSRDRFGRTVWALASILALKDGDGKWQEIQVGGASKPAK